MVINYTLRVLASLENNIHYALLSLSNRGIV
jgi:hypothetical protein